MYLLLMIKCRIDVGDSGRGGMMEIVVESIEVKLLRYYSVRWVIYVNIED